MFLLGPFLTFAFMDNGDRVGALTSLGTSTVQFVGSTGWDVMLSQAQAPIAYFAEIEPWVLTDRS